MTQERVLTRKWIAQFKSNIAATPIVMIDANLSPAALQASCECMYLLSPPISSNFYMPTSFIVVFYSQWRQNLVPPVWLEPVSVAKSRRIVSVAKYASLKLFRKILSYLRTFHRPRVFMETVALRTSNPLDPTSRWDMPGSFFLVL